VAQSVGNSFGIYLENADERRAVNAEFPQQCDEAEAIYRDDDGLHIFYFPVREEEKLYCEYGEGCCVHCGMGFFDGGAVEEMIRSRECPSRLRKELEAAKKELASGHLPG
jgi:hypothetical protein